MIFRGIGSQMHDLPEDVSRSVTPGEAELVRALFEYFRRLEWAHESAGQAVSFLELAIDFEVTTGFSFPTEVRAPARAAAPATAEAPPPESLVGPLPEGMPLLRYLGFFESTQKAPALDRLRRASHCVICPPAGRCICNF